MDVLVNKLNSASVQEFKSYVNNLDLKSLETFKNDLDNRYYNTGETTLHDSRYDMLVEILQARSPKLKLSVGCKLREKDNKTKLPFYLGGMDKIKMGEEKKLEDWKKNHTANSYFVSDKLNGVSCLAVFTEKGDTKLYTRGDCVEGADISYLKPHLHRFPSNCKNIAVRGELIIEDGVFKEKWKPEYKNSLSLIVSVVNAKSLKEPVSDIRFVAYEIVSESEPVQNIETQFLKLEKYGFETPIHILLPPSFTERSLIDHLVSRKSESKYDIDGLVVFVNEVYNRTWLSASGNPEYAFAFKMNTEVAETVVEDVEWNASRYGVLKPRIKVRPVELCNITVNYTSGFNADFIRKHKINQGSRVLITRSGDIIPYITDVISESEHWKEPDVEYEWNETNIDIHLNTCSQDVYVKKIVHFLVTIGVKQINEGLVKKLYEAGFTTVLKILAVKKEDLIAIPTIRDKLAERIVTSLEEGMKLMDIPKLMCASGVFGAGLGLKKATMLYSSIPNIFDDEAKITERDVCAVDGFSDKTARKIVEHIPEFKKFVEEFRPFLQTKVVEEEKGLKYKDWIVVFSGFRDEKLKRFLTENGAEVSDAVTKKTTHVVADYVDSKSQKVVKARLLKIPVILKTEFIF